MDKRRPSPNVAEIHHIIGEVEGRDAIIVDDIIDTAGTLCTVAKVLREKGRVRSVRAVATHGVLSGEAIERIAASPLDSVIVANTIPLLDKARSPKIVSLSVAPILAEAIRRIHEGESVSSLFV
jgi:ribose-phosphate pyrophosphokinase